MSTTVLVVLLIGVLPTNVLCNIRITPRIISGKPAETAQFPWQVVIKKSSADDIYCGGSIISKDWVLTAGHCVYGLKSIFMVFGTNDVDNQTISLTSTEFFMHPQYNPGNLNNDIAVVKLSKPLKFNTKIQPINLVKRDQASETFIGKTGLVSGWGLMSDEDLEYSKVLLFASMTVISNKDCMKTFGEIYIKDSTMCAKGISNLNESLCSGDSGGAFVTNINGQEVQIGINSFVVDQLCAEGHPAGFARVGSFLDFIQEITKIKLE